MLMDNIEYNIMPVSVQKILKAAKFWEKINPEMEIPLEAMLASCYPKAYDGLKELLTSQYAQGFKDGQKRKEEELNEVKRDDCGRLL